MIELKYVNGHIEIYENNQFVCSADNDHEAYNELSEVYDEGNCRG